MWLVGVGLVLAGLVVATCGMHLIRKSELKNQSGHIAEGWHGMSKSGPDSQGWFHELFWQGFHDSILVGSVLQLSSCGRIAQPSQIGIRRNLLFCRNLSQPRPRTSSCVSGYAFAPASIISPFTGFNIIANSLLLGHYSYMHLPPRTCSNSAPDSFVRAPPRPKQLLVRVAPITLGEQVT